MAVDTISTSRRTLLGVLSTAPLMALPALANAGSSTAWEAAKVAYLSLKNDQETFNRTAFEPLYIDCRRRFPTVARDLEAYREWAAKSGFDGVCDRVDEIGDAYVTATDRLIRTPAPDCDALAFKIEVVIESYEDCEMSDHAMQALLFDARAIAARYAT
jgi:hypothetical protein